MEEALEAAAAAAEEFMAVLAKTLSMSYQGPKEGQIREQTDSAWGRFHCFPKTSTMHSHEPHRWRRGYRFG